MAQAPKQKAKLLWTPRGMLSFPYFVEPNRDPTYGQDKFMTDLLIPKAIFKETGKELLLAVLECGNKAFGTTHKTLKDAKWKSPFKDTDSIEKVADERMRGHYIVRAKSKQQPAFIGPMLTAEKQIIHLTAAEISALKGGDWGKLYVSIFSYPQQGGGVSFGLNGFQFWKTGEGFGQAGRIPLSTVEELEVELDDAEPAGDGKTLAQAAEDII